jgi:hypothetical protein
MLLLPRSLEDLHLHCLHQLQTSVKRIHEPCCMLCESHSEWMTNALESFDYLDADLFQPHNHAGNCNKYTSGYPSAEAIGYIFYYQKIKPMTSNTMGAPKVKKWFPTSSGMLCLDQIMTSLKLP